MSTVVFILSGTTYAVPTNSANTIEGIGGGQGGKRKGGAGAKYCKNTNDAATGTISIAIGAGGSGVTFGGANTDPGSNGGDTTWNSTSLVAPGGGSATTAVGGVTNAGGAGANGGSGGVAQAGGGGGGSGAPSGAGKGGGTGSFTAGGGGGGSGAGSATAGSAGSVSTGGAGGKAQDNTAGGTGGSGAGSNGSHGSGGGGAGSGKGGNGGNGIEWTQTSDSAVAGGGGGGGGGSINGNGGTGGNYGGGGGGAAQENGVGSGTGGDGAQGILVFTYTPSATVNNKTISVTQGSAASLIRSAGKILRASLAVATALIKVIKKPINATAVAMTAVVSAVRVAFGSPTMTASVSIAVGASLVKAVGKLLATPLTLIAVSGGNAVSRVINASVGTTATLSRSTAKLILIAQAIMAASLRNQVRKPILLTLLPAPTLAPTKTAPRVLSASAGASALLLRTTGKLLTTLPQINLTPIGSANTSSGAPLALDGFAHGSFSNPITCSLTTTNPNDIIIVATATYAGGGPSAPTITGVTASGLTFTKRSGTGVTAISGAISADFELWWAVAASPLSAKTISASLSGGATDVAIMAFGISGADTSSPFDSNASLPKTTISTSSGVPSVSNFSTTSINDFIFNVAFMFNPAGLNHPASGYTDIDNFTSGGNAIRMDAMYDIVSATQSNTTISWGASEGGGGFGFICYGDAVKQGFTSPVVASITGVTVPAGSTIFALASSSGTGGELTVTDSAGNTYTAVSGGSVKYGTLYYCRNCLALSNGSIQVSGSAADDVSIQACYATGIFAQADPLDLNTAGTSGTGTTLSITSGTPAVPGELFIAAASFSAAASVFTQASGWAACSAASNTETSTGSGVNQTQQWGYIVGQDALAKTYNPTINVSEAWNTPVLASFKPQTSLNALMWRSSGKIFSTSSAVATAIRNKVGKIIIAANSVAVAFSQMQSFRRIFAPQIGSTVSVQRAVSRIINITRASLATLLKSITKLPFTMTSSVLATIQNKIGLVAPLATSIPVVAFMGQYRAFIRAFTTQVGSTVTSYNIVGKIINVTRASSVTLQRAITRQPFLIAHNVVASLRNQVGIAAALITSIPVAATISQYRSFIRAFASQIGTSVTSSRIVSKIINVTRASVVTLRRNLSNTVAVISQPVTAQLRNGISISSELFTSIGVAASINQFRSFIRSFAAQVGTATTVQRSIGKIINATRSLTVTLRRQAGHIINATQSVAAATVLSTKKVIAAAIGTTVSLSSIRTFTRIFNINQGTSTLFATLQGFVIGLTQGTSVRLFKQQKKIITTTGLPHLLTLRANIFRAVFISAGIGPVVSLRRNIGKIIRALVNSAINNVFRHIRDSSGSTEPALIRAGNNVFLITVQGHDGSSVRTLYFSTEGKMSVPADTPSNTYYEPRVIDPGNFERHLFSSGTTRGRASVGEGDVVLTSGDSGRSGDTLDYILSWAFDGYRILIQSLTSVRQEVVNAKTLFTGTIEQIITNDAYNQISFKIHDRLSDLSLPLLTDTFGGTTTSGGGGTADGNADLAGQKKQECFGTVFNIPGQVANAYDLVWLFSNNGAHSITVKDGGVALTNDGDVANLAALLAWTQVAGHYKTCLALGMARLGSSPVFGITADVSQGATSADRTAAQIAKTMLLNYGISSGDIDSSSVTTLDSKNSAELGILVTGDTTCLDAATQVLDSIGGYLVPNNLGVFQVGRFEAPAVSSPDLALDLDEDTIIGNSLSRIATGDDGRGIPTWRVTINYGQNYTVQKETQLAGAVSDADRLFYANQWRTAAQSDSSVQTRHKLAVDVTINSCFAYEADASAEATRLLTLHKVRRDAYQVGVTLDYGADANIGSVVRITSPRFGLSGGQLFTVIGRVDDYENKLIQLDVWG